MKTTSLATALVASLLLSGAARAVEPAAAGDIMLRGRVIGVLPDDSSGHVTGIPDSGVGVDDAWTLEVDLTIFASPHWAFELIAATTSHDIQGEGSLAGLGRIADASVLPPTLTVQYHFLPEAKVQPYLGAGVNYTAFYDEDISSSLEAALGGKGSINLDDSWGWAGQVGFDVALTDHWYFNLDVKYIDIQTTAKIVDSLGGVSKVDVDINPWVPGVGVGYRW